MVTLVWGCSSVKKDTSGEIFFARLGYLSIFIPTNKKYVSEYETLCPYP